MYAQKENENQLIALMQYKKKKKNPNIYFVAM